MKAASISEIKNELKSLTPAQLAELCLRLARFKKENKELLTYLLFEAQDQDAYLQGVKEEMETAFAEVNWSHLYFAKKTIRKILRMAQKYSRYTGSKQAEAELLIHFCQLISASGKPIHKSTALKNLYEAQVKKAQALIDTLHEDLQYEYKIALRRLQEQDL